MEKKANPGLFVNDGSFMERFKQLQQGQSEKAIPSNETKPTVPAGSSTHAKPSAIANKRALEVKANDGKKVSPASSGGKLAFSLKQKAKVVAPAIKLGEDEEEERGDFGVGSRDETTKRQKLGASDVSQPSSRIGDVVPASPSDPAVRNVADRLATFVAKHGRKIEHVTRQKNPGDTPFKFLFDSSCSDYKYYEYRLVEEEKALAQAKDSQAPQSITGNTTTSRSSSISQRSSMQHHPNYQTPASALYASSELPGGSSADGESSGPSASDAIAKMEYYMKRAAQEERKRPHKQSKDEMPPPAYLQAATEKKGHHMGDYIPPEELEKFLASCNDSAAQKAAQEAADRAKIQADNIGHKLLSKMGWREGEGLGSGKSGRADPVMAGGVKLDNLGVGATRPDEVTPGDDIYEQYKKRMMLGYRHRPNPLGNPRKKYY